MAGSSVVLFVPFLLSLLAMSGLSCFVRVTQSSFTMHGHACRLWPRHDLGDEHDLVTHANHDNGPVPGAARDGCVRIESLPAMLHGESSKRLAPPRDTKDRKHLQSVQRTVNRHNSQTKHQALSKGQSRSQDAQHQPAQQPHTPPAQQPPGLECQRCASTLACSCRRR